MSDIKKVILIIVNVFVIKNAIGQTNTFPASGNVGIGTISPATTLHVQADNAATWDAGQFIISSVTNSNKKLSFGFDVASNIGFIQSLISGDNYYPLALNPHGGNIGIGTSTPANVLEVHKDQDAGTFIVARNSASSTSAYTGISASSQNQGISIMANSDGFARPYPGFHTSSVSILGNAANGLNIISDAGLGTPGVNSGMIRFITYSNSGGVTSTVAGNDAFTRMIIDGNGRVGIGTLAPSEKLSVAGNVRAQKMIVTQTGWSDYVFDSSYQLRSLLQVEQFIKENKHLPDVPSVKEVEEKGISVGENQAVLLKKIEELTLYMIEIKKENEVMKSKGKKQEEKIDLLEKELNTIKNKQAN